MSGHCTPEQARNISVSQGWATDQYDQLWVLGQYAPPPGYTWDLLHQHLASISPVLESKIDRRYPFTRMAWIIHPTRAAGLVTNPLLVPLFKLEPPWGASRVPTLSANLPNLSANGVSFGISISDATALGTNCISVAQSNTGRQGDVAFMRGNIPLPQV